jgi:hypothetical protein
VESEEFVVSFIPFGGKRWHGAAELNIPMASFHETCRKHYEIHPIDSFFLDKQSIFAKLSQSEWVINQGEVKQECGTKF